MADIKFTDEQRAVIDARKSNILVSAAAGSGKTAVLVERIIKIIEEGVDVDHLLVVTFTKAAASQMKEKITEAVRKKLSDEPDNLHMQRQETLIHNAQITTIDSFCQYIIRNNFNAIGLDPAFRVGDEGELKLLKEDVMKELLEDMYENSNEESDFIFCMNYFSTGSSDDKAEEYINQLFGYSMSMPWPEDWLKERAADYDIEGKDFDSLYWVKECITYTIRILSECVEKIEDCKRVSLEPDGPYMYSDILDADKVSILAALQYDTYDALFTGVRGIEFGRLPTKKDDSVNVDKRAYAKGLRDEVKADIAKLQEGYYALPKETIIEQMKLCDRAIKELCHLTLEFKRRFDEKKREKGLIDFSDMEHFALKILVDHPADDECEGLTSEEIIERCTPSTVALEYRDYYREVLIDEYQDSNNVQELILKSVTGECTDNSDRFMVGDVKQSIYKFRLARPEIFMEKLRTFDKSEDARDRRIDLHKNFRSRAKVLDITNYIFRRIMGPDIGGVDYDSDAELVAGAEFDEPCYNVEPEFLIVNGSDIMDTDQESEEAVKKLNSREKEALAVAERIIKLRKENKDLMYKDVVILLRSLSGWDDVFKRVLESQGIPTYIESKSGYFEAPEVSVLLNMLSVIDNPRQDIPLVSVMHSCIGEFTDEELALIKIAINKSEELSLSDSMYDGIYAIAQGSAEEIIEEKLHEKLKEFVSMIEQFRAMSTYTPVHELLQEVIDRTAFDHKMAAMPAGGQRSANIELLLSNAVNFEKTSFKGLFHFVRYIEHIKIVQADYGEAGVIDENADVVRIMSIHKSKGLEFPVVFVSGLSKEFNRMDVRGDLITDVDLGVGVKCINTDIRVKYDTLKRRIIADKMIIDNLGEEIRVLYVALTRAKEKLIMTAYSKDLSNFLTSKLGQISMYSTSSRLMPYSKRVSAQSYFDLVMQALILNPSLRQLLEKYEIPTDGFDEHSDDPTAAPSIEFRVIGEANLKADYVAAMAEGIMREESLKAVLCSAAAKTEDEKLSEDIDSKMYDRLKLKFSARYAHEDLKGLFTKTTVSELKKAGMEEICEISVSDADFVRQTEAEAVNEELYVNEDKDSKEVIEKTDIVDREETKESENDSKENLKPKALTGAERGTAYHRVMELLDEDIYGDASFMQKAANLREKSEDESSDTAEIAGLTDDVSKRLYAWACGKTEAGFLSEDQKRAVWTPDIATFLATELGQRMGKAFRDDKLMREKPFMMGVAAKEINPAFPEEEMVLVQGIIDAWFIEDGEIVLLDYKTDRVKEEEDLVNRYRIQLYLYKRALEAASGLKVKEVYIYSFALGSVIKM